MNTIDRRNAILEIIKKSDTPISATHLAKQFDVSRQVVVGDIAILRAKQHPIIATARGYLYNNKEEAKYVIACLHEEKDTEDELNCIVDNGGIIENVIISHPIYGELSGSLHIESRYDVKQFIEKCHTYQARNLSELSNGVHFHTLQVKDEKAFERIKEELNKKGYLYKK